MRSILLTLMAVLAVVQLLALDTLRIPSVVLSQEVRCFVEPGAEASCRVIYFTDGQKMLENGALDSIQFASNTVSAKPHLVFVSTIDESTGEDFRNQWFFCNQDYLRFFQTELMPVVEAHLAVGKTDWERTLVGVSFGGLNAAWFSAQEGAGFSNYILLSPVTYPCPDLLEQLAFRPPAKFRVFLSTGRNDAETYLTPLAALYQHIATEVKIHHTNGGHDFENWNQQWFVVFRFIDVRR